MLFGNNFAVCAALLGSATASIVKIPAFARLALATLPTPTEQEIDVRAAAADPASTTMPTWSRWPCPQALAENFVLPTDQSPWQLFCNTDLYYNDIGSYNSTNMGDCMRLCQVHNAGVKAKQSGFGTIPCVSITYSKQDLGLSNNCFLKSSVSQAIYNAYGFDSAKLDSYDLPDSLAVSVYQNQIAEATAATAVPTGPYQPAASPCPYTNQTYLQNAASNGNTTYKVSCDTSMYWNDLPGLYTNNFNDCVKSCDDWVPVYDPDYINGFQPCIGVSYEQYVPPKAGSTTTANCHRKYAVSSRGFGALPHRVAATRVITSVPGSLITTFTPGVTAAAAAAGSATTTSNPTTTTTSGRNVVFVSRGSSTTIFSTSTMK